MCNCIFADTRASTTGIIRFRPRNNDSCRFCLHRERRRRLHGVGCPPPRRIARLSRFLVLVATSEKSATTITIARLLVGRVFPVFSAPETLRPDQGAEFENELVKQLQSVFGLPKRRAHQRIINKAIPLQNAHSTVHIMLAMYVDDKYQVRQLGRITTCASVCP